MASPENIRISHSAESETRVSVERYLEDLRADIQEEVERIANEEQMLGEGKAAEVFVVNQMRRSRCEACIKVWRPGLEEIKGKDPVAYSKIQTMEPSEEFKLQDELYVNGFTDIPRPFAYIEVDGLRAMAMERIKGYTLEELEQKGATITDPSWKELEQMLVELTKKYGVVHRDLHKGNIMLETDDDITKTNTISGTLKFIDFGLSKRIYGTPEAEDFKLTIGNNVIRYPEDKSRIEQLKPNARVSYNVFSR